MYLKFSKHRAKKNAQVATLAMRVLENEPTTENSSRDKAFTGIDVAIFKNISNSETKSTHEFMPPAARRTKGGSTSLEKGNQIRENPIRTITDGEHLSD